MKEEHRKYHRAHREEHNASMREWREANREKIATYSREYHKAHREEIAKKKREYREANRDKKNARQAKRRALKREATVGDQDAVDDIYDIAKNGNRVRCYLCGELIPKGDRHVDHIIPLSKGGDHTASNLAIACAACNREKHAKLPEEIGLLL